jgi:hypothetical protein
MAIGHTRQCFASMMSFFVGAIVFGLALLLLV